MRMMNLLNHTHRGVVLHWGNAKSVADRPDLAWVPYLGGFVVVAPGQVLPPEADVLAQQAAYEAQMTTGRARATRDAALAVHDQDMIRGVDDLVALAKAAGWPVPQALLDKTNARRVLRGQPPL